MNKNHRILGWHFAQDDGCLGYGDGRKIIAGRILSVDCEPRCCQRGLHCSRSIVDALSYSRGVMLCRVEVWGDVHEIDDNLCGTHRKTIGMANASTVLHEFAVWCARRALKLVDDPDPRSVKALRVKSAWLKGKASDEELAAARDDARASWAASWSARAASWAASRAASWSARDAARAAWDASCLRGMMRGLRNKNTCCARRTNCSDSRASIEGSSSDDPTHLQARQARPFGIRESGQHGRTREPLAVCNGGYLHRRFRDWRDGFVAEITGRPWGEPCAGVSLTPIKSGAARSRSRPNF
jgi:hypothetical protein